MKNAPRPKRLRTVRIPDAMMRRHCFHRTYGKGWARMRPWRLRGTPWRRIFR